MLGEELLVEVAELEVVKIDDVAIVHHAVHRGHECPRIGLGEVPLLHPKHGRMVLQEAKRGRELLGVLGGVVAIGVGALELEDRRERAPVEQRQRPRIEVRDVDRPKQEMDRNGSPSVSPSGLVSVSAPRLDQAADSTTSPFRPTVTVWGSMEIA